MHFSLISQTKMIGNYLRADACLSRLRFNGETSFLGSLPASYAIIIVYRRLVGEVKGKKKKEKQVIVKERQRRGGQRRRHVDKSIQ